MTKNYPYSQYLSEHLILRDQLVADRALLANERTYLSYVFITILTGIDIVNIIMTVLTGYKVFSIV